MILRPELYLQTPIDRAAEQQRIGLDADTPTDLVLFGGTGSRAMKRIAERLPETSLILMYGRNQALADGTARPAGAGGGQFYDRGGALDEARRRLYRQTRAGQPERGGTTGFAGDRHAQSLDHATGALEHAPIPVAPQGCARILGAQPAKASDTLGIHLVQDLRGGAASEVAILRFCELDHDFSIISDKNVALETHWRGQLTTTRDLRPLGIDDAPTYGTQQPDEAIDPSRTPRI
jgi:hypothetical protein